MERGRHRGRGETDNSISVQYSANNYHIIYVMALLGATEKQMCEALGVSQSAITYNKLNNPEFWAAFQKGRIEADVKVAEGLYLNTQDRYVDDEQISVWKGEVIRIPIKRFIQGDKIAQLKWLAARSPEQWRESQNMNIHKVNINANIDFKDFSIDDMKQLENMGLKQLSEFNTVDE